MSPQALLQILDICASPVCSHTPFFSLLSPNTMTKQPGCKGTPASTIPKLSFPTPPKNSAMQDSEYLELLKKRRKEYSSRNRQTPDVCVPGRSIFQSHVCSERFITSDDYRSPSIFQSPSCARFSTSRPFSVSSGLPPLSVTCPKNIGFQTSPFFSL